MQTDFGDLRFIWYNETSRRQQEIPYWVGIKKASSFTSCWVKIPFVRENTYYSKNNTTLFLYYGNPNAKTTSDFDGTFTKDFEESDLAALWHMDEGFGETLSDSSGNKNAGNLKNGIKWSTEDGGQWDGRSDAKFSTGSALSFDGVDDYVEVPYSNSLNVTDSLTIEAWIKTSNANVEYQMILTKSEEGAINYWELRFWGTHGKLELILRIDGAGPALQGNTKLSNDTWYHVAATYDGSQMKLYINGSLDNSMSQTGKIETSQVAKINIGRRWDGYFFNGFIDEVRIYTRALSAEEIKAHYERRKYANPDPAVYMGIKEVYKVRVYLIETSGNQKVMVSKFYLNDTLGKTWKWKATFASNSIYESDERGYIMYKTALIPGLNNLSLTNILPLENIKFYLKEHNYQRYLSWNVKATVEISLQDSQVITSQTLNYTLSNLGNVTLTGLYIKQRFLRKDGSIYSKSKIAVLNLLPNQSRLENMHLQIPEEGGTYFLNITLAYTTTAEHILASQVVELSIHDIPIWTKLFVFLQEPIVITFILVMIMFATWTLTLRYNTKRLRLNYQD